MMELINPFQLHGSPTQLLCPWRYSSHRELYVDVDNSARAFQDFIQAMGDLSTLLTHGQLVLVTGETGCGKSALINRCVDWLIEELTARQLRGEVVDLTRTMNGMPQLPVADRLSAVCGLLLDQLNIDGLLTGGAFEALAPNNSQPDRIYPYLTRVLKDDWVLIVLLPTPADLRNEVIRYAGLARGRVLFLVESALLDEDDVSEILRAQRDWIPPIRLCVSPLRPGDVRKFAFARLGHHSDRGSYPRMSDGTLDSVESALRSIAQLQQTLFATYETRRRDGLPYDQDSWVTDDEIRRQFWQGLGGGR